MKTSHINNLKDLRAAKVQLKNQMSQADKEAENSFIYSLLNKIFSNKKKSTELHNAAMDSGTSGAIGFLASQNKKFDYSKIGKLIFSVGMTIIAPILARKLGSYLGKKA